MLDDFGWEAKAMRVLTCSRTDKCRIRRSRSCNDMRLRRKRDFSVRIPILKLPFRFRVQ